MFEAYRIGVTVVLRNQAARGLRSISQEMQAAQRATNALQRDLRQLERVTGPDGLYARRAQTNLDRSAALTRQMDDLAARQAAKTRQLSLLQQRLQQTEETYGARRAERLARLSELSQSIEHLRNRAATAELATAKQLEGIRRQKEAVEERTARQIADRQARLSQIRRRQAILEGAIEVQRAQFKDRLAKLDEKRAFFAERIAARQAKGQRSEFLERRYAQLTNDRELLVKKAELAESRFVRASEKNARDLSVVQGQLQEAPRRRAAELARLTEQQMLVQQRAAVASEAIARRVQRQQNEEQNVRRKIQNADRAHALQMEQLRSRAMRLAEEEASLGRRLAEARQRQEEAQRRAADYNRRREEAERQRAAHRRALEERRAELEAITRRRALIGGLQTAGTAALVTGGALGWLLSKTYEPAKRLQAARAKLEAAGVGPRMRADIERRVMQLQDRVPTADTATMLDAFLDLRAVFGDEGMAMRALPNMLRLSAILGTVSGKKMSVNEIAKQMAQATGRAIDLRGKALDPESFFKEANEMARVMIWSEGQITPATYQTAFRYMRSARYTPSQEFMYRYFPTWMAMNKSLTGSGAHGGAGTGFQSLTKMLLTGTGFTKEQVALGMELGLIRPQDVNERGRLKPGRSLLYTELGGKELFNFARNPFFWIRDVLIPAIEKYLIKNKIEVTPDNMTAVVQRLIRHGTAADVVATAVRSWREIERDAKMIGRGEDISAYRKFLRKHPEMMEMALWSQWESLKQELGDALMPLVLVYLPKLTQGVRSFTQLMDRHPEMTKFVVKATAVAAGLAVVGGAFSLVSAGALALVSPIRGVWSAARVAGPVVLRLASWLGRLGKVINLPGWARLSTIAGGFLGIFSALNKFDEWLTKMGWGQAPGISPIGRTDPNKPIHQQFADWLSNPHPAVRAFGPLLGIDPFKSARTPATSGWHPPLLLDGALNQVPIINIDLGGINMDGRQIGNYVWRDAARHLDAQSTGEIGFDRRQSRTVSGAPIRR